MKKKFRICYLVLWTAYYFLKSRKISTDTFLGSRFLEISRNISRNLEIYQRYFPMKKMWILRLLKSWDKNISRNSNLLLKPKMSYVLVCTLSCNKNSFIIDNIRANYKIIFCSNFTLILETVFVSSESFLDILPKSLEYSVTSKSQNFPKFVKNKFLFHWPFYRIKLFVHPWLTVVIYGWSLAGKKIEILRTLFSKNMNRTRATITRSWLETALEY